MANIYGTGNADSILPWYVSPGVTGGFPSNANDWIFSYGGNDYINAGGGNNRVYAGAGDDRIYTGSGSDYIDGGKGVDTMSGGSGNDTYIVDDTRDRIYEYAGGGIDTVEASTSYSLQSQPHLENLTLLGAISFGYGNNANNVIDAKYARRLASGMSVVLRGEGGNDTIRGVDSFGTTDEIYGGDQADWLYGNDGNDRLYGENHMDFLSGGDDNDYLMGGGSTDTLRGERGDDILIGNSNRAVSDQGPEFDALWGGSGRDTFILGGWTGAYYQDAGYAIIKDFERFSSDTIQLGGPRSFYRLGVIQLTSSGPQDTEILYNGNRIAVIENQVGLDLNANYFRYV